MPKAIKGKLTWIQKISFKSPEQRDIFYLALIYLSLFLAKIIISLNFRSPFSLPDEVEYFLKASSIFHTQNPFGSIPVGGAFPGYPLVLSVFFLGGGSSLAIYHSILIFNAFLSSVLVFPVYFILKEFCDRKYCIIGTIIVAVLPAINVYSFSVLSENLLIPLIMFSLWFFVELRKKNAIILYLLFCLTLFLLILNRPTGFLVALSFMIVLFFENVVKGSTPRRVLILVLSAAICVAAGIVLGNFVIQNNIIVSGYNVSDLVTGTLDLLGTTSFFIQITVAFLSQVEYLFISCYGIFVVLAGLLVLSMFHPLGKLKTPSGDHSEGLDTFHQNVLKELVLVILTFSLLLMVITSFYLTEYSKTTSLAIDIYGRYVDPMVPLVFTLGIISLSLLLKKVRSFPRSTFMWTSGIYIFIITAIILTFPLILKNNYIDVSVLSIWYLIALKNVIPTGILISALLFGVAGVFLLSNCSQKMKTRFLVCIIVLSIFITSVALTEEITLSSQKDSQNSFGKFLSEHTTDSTVTALDWNSMKVSDYAWLALFMAKGDVVPVFLPYQEGSFLNFLPQRRVDYLITKESLNYTLEAGGTSATGGLKLYNITSP